MNRHSSSLCESGNPALQEKLTVPTSEHLSNRKCGMIAESPAASEDLSKHWAVNDNSTRQHFLHNKPCADHETHHDAGEEHWRRSLQIQIVIRESRRLYLSRKTIRTAQ